MSSLNNPKTFTELALYKGLYSSWLYPSNCKLRVIENPKPSLRETLAELDFDPFEPLEKNYKAFHNLGKPVRLVARTVYYMAVLMIIPIIGASFHGTKSGYYFLKSKVWDVYRLNNISIARQDMNRCITERKRALLEGGYTHGGLCLYFCIYLPIAAPVLTPLMAPFLVVGILLAYDRFITRVMNSDGCVKAHLFKNKLGLVGPKGSRLPFNKRDIEFRVELYPHKSPKMKRSLLHDLFIDTENSLLEAIKSANQLLRRQKSGTTFHPCNSYGRALDPYSIKKRLKLIENDPFHSNDPFQASDLRGSLLKVRKTLNKYERVRDIYSTVQNSQLNSIRDAGKILSNSFNPRNAHDYNYINSFFNPSYREPPNSQGSSKGSSNRSGSNFQRDDWAEYLSKLSVPEFEARSEFEAFKLKVLQKKPPRELLGLAHYYSQHDLKKAYNKLKLILHPDKNGNSQESTQLFLALQEAYKRLTS